MSHPAQHYPPPTLPDSKSAASDSSLSKTSSSFRHRTFHTAFGPLSVNNFLRKDWIKYYVFLVLLLIAIAVVAIYHHQIVIALHPFVLSMRNLKINGVEVGWLIPVAVLFIISFPPLFGHEIVIILCGLVWGLWLGFAIVCLGTLLGELANYWTFKYACSGRAAKLEKKDLNYACMCVVIREGGFWIAFLARLSAIPGHLVTPVFATTGMSLTIFTAATVLSMPKQLAGVYLGTLFNTSSSTEEQQGGKGSSAVKYSVLGLTFLVTVVAALYIYKKMATARAAVQRGPAAPLPLHRHPDSPSLEHAGLRDTRAYEHAPSPHPGPRPSASSEYLGPRPGSPAGSDDPCNPFADPRPAPRRPQSPGPSPAAEGPLPWPPSAPASPALPSPDPFVDPPYLPILPRHSEGSPPSHYPPSRRF